jgi:outer membrane protein
MENITRHYFLLFLITLGLPLAGNAQVFSLKDCIDYALANHPHIRKARLEQEKTTYRIQELKSDFLPQVNMDAGIGYNFELPTTVAPGTLFNTNQEDVGIQFGQAINTHVGIEVRQLAYSKAMKIGRDGIGQLQEVNQLMERKTKEAIAHAIAKRYYQTLIVREKRNLLVANLDKVNGLVQLIQKQFDNGFAKKIDVDRLRVAKTNLQSKLTNLDLQYQQLLDVLKYEMAMPFESVIQLPENLPAVDVSLPTDTTFDGSQKAEIALLQKQRDLLGLQQQRLKAGYYPSIYVQGQLGVTLLGDNLSEIGNREHWYSMALLGVQLEMPIFDGHRRRAQIEQNRVTQAQQMEDLRFATQALELQHNRSIQQLRVLYNELEALDDNQKVAADIFAVMQKRYAEGVGPIMDLLDAETAMREAQTNYLTALLDFKLAALDLLYAKGTLLDAF